MQSLRNTKPEAGRFRTSRSIHPELTALRRDLHAHPELGFEEVYTSKRVKEALTLCGVDEIHEGIGRTGVVGVIRGRSTSSGSMVRPARRYGCAAPGRAQRFLLEVVQTRPDAWLWP